MTEFVKLLKTLLKIISVLFIMNISTISIASDIEITDIDDDYKLAGTYDGFFGFQLGSKHKHNSKIVLYEDIDKYDDAKFLKELIKKVKFSYIGYFCQNAQPSITNKDFNKFSICTTPLKERIYKIYATGDPLINEQECKNRLEFYKKFFFEKYGKEYDVDMKPGLIKIDTKEIEFKLITKKLVIKQDFPKINFYCNIEDINYKKISALYTSHFSYNFENEKHQYLNKIMKRIKEIEILDSNADSSGL